MHAFVAPGRLGTQAQQAVEAALLQDAGDAARQQPKALTSSGSPLGTATCRDNRRTAPAHGPPGPSTPRPAARRAAAAARHAWLATHLAALRAGQLTLAQLP